jgi:hypothetical protein
VKATPAADGTVSLEPVTISWLPAEGPVRPLHLRASAGKNYSLEETFAIAAQLGLAGAKLGHKVRGRSCPVAD